MMKMMNIFGFKKRRAFSAILILSYFLTPLKAAQEITFGRLFSLPAERNHLDDLRKNQKLKIVSPQTEINEALITPPVVSSEPITLQGYVKRSDGTKSTLWINNQAVQEGSLVDNVEVGQLNQRYHAKGTQAADAVELKMSGTGKHIRLKAGQIYEPDTNQIKELRTVEKERQFNLEESGTITDDNIDSRKSFE